MAQIASAGDPTSSPGRPDLAGRPDLRGVLYRAVEARRGRIRTAGDVSGAERALSNAYAARGSIQGRRARSRTHTRARAAPRASGRSPCLIGAGRSARDRATAAT